MTINIPSVPFNIPARVLDVSGVEQSVANAATSATQAGTEADRAEAARDAAFVNANVFADISTGRAAVADGEQFQVVAGEEIIRYRRDSSSTQTEVARYPSAAKVDAVDQRIDLILKLPDGAEILWPAIKPTPLDWYDTGLRFFSGAQERKLITNVFAADFYVDSVNGDDTNNGLTADTAFATIAKVQTEAVAFGDGVKIALAAGSKWREWLSLGTIPNPTVMGFGDFTTQALPELTCADVAPNANFSLASGQTNTYQITWTHDVSTAIVKYKLRVWENGEKLKWVASVAACEAEAGTFHVSNSELVNPSTIYVHPTGSTNPTTDGKEYEITARDHALTGGVASDVRFVHTSKNAGHDGSIILPQNAYAEGVLASDGVVHNFWVSVGGTAKNCVAYDCEPSSWRNLNATLFITFRGTGGAGATYQDCYAYFNRGADERIIGGYAHTSGGGSVLTEIAVDGFRCFAPTQAFSCADTLNFSVSNTYAQWPSGFNSDTGGFGGASVSNTLTNVTAINTGRLMQFGEGYVVDNLRAYWDGSPVGGAIWRPGTIVRNSTFAFNPSLTTTQAILFVATAGAAVIFEDNVVQNALTSGLRALTAGGITSDRNVYVNAGALGATRLVGSTSYSTISAWRTATGQDLNTFAAVNTPSIIADPANNDFTFTSSVVDEGGRTAGSRMHIDTPDWTALVASWESGRLGALHGLGA